MSGPEGVLLRLFDAEHRRVLSVGYLCAFKRDLTLIRAALAVYGEERLSWLIRSFWECQGLAIQRPPVLGRTESLEDWVGKARPDVRGLISQIPNLLKLSPPAETDNSPEAVNQRLRADVEGRGECYGCYLRNCQEHPRRRAWQPPR